MVQAFFYPRDVQRREEDSYPARPRDGRGEKTTMIPFFQPQGEGA